MPALRPLFARPLRAGWLLALAVIAACGEGGSTTPDGPTATPAAIRAEGGSAQTGRVGAALPQQLTVLVLDAQNRPIRNVSVEFRPAAGSGTTSPARASTGADGRVSTTWTLGTVAGAQSVSASALGVTAVNFLATGTPGPATQVAVSPPTANLPVGDTLRVQGIVRDEFGNAISGGSVTWTSDAPAIASVSALGTVRAVAIGTTTVRATATGGSLVGQLAVTVLPVGASVCGAQPPVALRVGEVAPLVSAASASTLCVSADIAGAEYGLVTVSGSTVFANSTPFTVSGQGLASLNAISAADDLGAVLGVGAARVRAASSDAIVAAASAASAMREATWPRDEGFEQRLRAIERQELAPLRTARPVTDTDDQLPFRSFNTPRTATVGQILTLNANASSACQSPDNRGGRVVAIGDKIIVVADTANPSGGYTDDEYRTIAAYWDSVIHPLDVQNFGEPSNIGGYGKIIAFYTRAVNQLTPRGANFVIGGFFFQRDLFPKTTRPGFSGCAGSNEAEMMYLLVPDPTGVVNGNVRDKARTTQFNYGTLVHEFQHLINAGRRLHVTPGGDDVETVWLDEGLAHTAEELLFYRVSGLDATQNLTLQRITATTPIRDAFNSFGLANMVRLGDYLQNPSGNSPWAPNDQLSTRGAIWQFLRFASARTSDIPAYYRRLADAPQSGIANLQANLPAPLPDLLRDWAIANLADDVAAGLPATVSFPSWNFRSVILGLRQSNGEPLFGAYPLPVRVLANNTPAEVTVQGGGAAFLRFSIPAARSGLITVQSNGGALPSTARTAVVRLR